MEEKKVVKEYECTNCDWNGTELSKCCKTRGSFKLVTKVDGNQEYVHKLNEDGIQKCAGCGYLDNKCPICGDEVGEPGIREKIRKQKLAEEKARADSMRGKAYL
jgi:hypothetical protein